VRFGMGAVKGVGSGAVATIVENRKDGRYKSIFDLTKRIDLRAANKKALENLVLAGGFDSFLGTTRAQYFHDDGDGITFYEKAIRYGSKYQENENSSQVSLFGESSDVQIAEPVVPPCEDWSTMEKLAKEKEVVGIYISGHPLDDYKFEMKYFCNAKLEALKNMELHVSKNLAFGGIINNVQHRVAKNGKGWGMFTLEGYDESYEFRIFGEEYLKFRHFFIQNNFTFMKVLVKEGWTDRDTGKKGEPRLQFVEVKQLQDVLETFAKKLIVLLNIKDLETDFIHKLSHLFQENKGDNTVSFEVMELEKTKRLVAVAPVELENEEVAFIDENEDSEMGTLEIPEANSIAKVEEVEEIKVVTKLTMPSRKLKIKISNELLVELEKMQINFKLN
jgi:DNA polymerase-3 subunit alpha